MNVATASFSSQFRYEHIAIKDHVSFTTSGGGTNTATITIAHNLGYIPFFRVFFLFPSDSFYYGSFNGPVQNLGNWQINDINPDSTNLYISLTNYTSSVLTGIIYYRIYAEPQAI